MLAAAIVGKVLTFTFLCISRKTYKLPEGTDRKELQKISFSKLKLPHRKKKKQVDAIDRQEAEEKMKQSQTLTLSTDASSAPSTPMPVDRSPNRTSLVNAQVHGPSKEIKGASLEQEKDIGIVNSELEEDEVIDKDYSAENLEEKPEDALKNIPRSESGRLICVSPNSLTENEEVRTSSLDTNDRSRPEVSLAMNIANSSASYTNSVCAPDVDE
jgi:hypothetical protein